MGLGQFPWRQGQAQEGPLLPCRVIFSMFTLVGGWPWGAGLLGEELAWFALSTTQCEWQDLGSGATPGFLSPATQMLGICWDRLHVHMLVSQVAPLHKLCGSAICSPLPPAGEI